MSLLDIYNTYLQRVLKRNMHIHYAYLNVTILSTCVISLSRPFTKSHSKTQHHEIRTRTNEWAISIGMGNANFRVTISYLCKN